MPIDSDTLTGPERPVQSNANRPPQNPLSVFRQRKPSSADADLAGAALRDLAIDEPSALALAHRLLAGDAEAGRELARHIAQTYPAPAPDDPGDPVATALWLAGRCREHGGRSTVAQRDGALGALIESVTYAQRRLADAQDAHDHWASWASDDAPGQAGGDGERLARQALALARRRLADATRDLRWTTATDELARRLARSVPTPARSELRSPVADPAPEPPPPPGPARIVAPQAETALARLSSADQRRLGWLRPLARPLPEAPLPIEVDAAFARLGTEMPNMKAALTWLQAGLALRRVCGVPTTRVTPMLLVGAPGVGKTRFVRRLATELGLSWGRLSLEGLSDNRALAGTSSGWSTAEPAWPVAEIARLGVANPLLMLDEIDKCVASHNGDAHATLLGWLEPSTAAAVVDPVLGPPIDLSGVSWILAANSIDRLPAPLLGRVHVVNVDLLPLAAFDTVLAGVLTDIADELGVPDARLLPSLDTAEIELLRRVWRPSRTPRLLRRVVERLLGEAATRSMISPRH